MINHIKTDFMKKLFIFFIFCSNISFSQIFTLDELVNISNMNTDEFDSFVISKGYEFFKTETDDYSENIIYAHNLKSNNIAPSYISKYMFKKNPNTMVSYQTLEKEVYISIKKQIKNGSSFYTHLNLFQRIKLKWMRNEYDIQSKEIKIEILKYFLTILLSFIGGVFYERNQIEKATPEITPKNAPKAVVNTSLENKIFKKSIKKDTIIVK